MLFKIQFGQRLPNVKRWGLRLISTATALFLVSYLGNALLQSKHGNFFRDAICLMSKKFPEGDVGKLLSTMCGMAEDKFISEDEAKIILERAREAANIPREYFNDNQKNTQRRSEDEVRLAVEDWERLNPSPKIDKTLREQFPSLTEEQLCVLSQAERYIDGDAIGIRYAGMEVCEDER